MHINTQIGLLIQTKNKMLDLNTIYNATSDEGFHFRLILQELINDAPVTYSCYDEEYLHYNLVLDSNLVGGKLMYLGDEPTEYNVIVEVETQHMSVKDELLCVLYNGYYVLWADMHSIAIRELIQCDDGYDVCKVLDFKYLKTTGNYRVKMLIEGEGYSRVWSLLLDGRGEILKKAEEFE